MADAGQGSRRRASRRIGQDSCRCNPRPSPPPPRLAFVTGLSARRALQLYRNRRQPARCQAQKAHKVEWLEDVQRLLIERERVGWPISGRSNVGASRRSKSGNRLKATATSRCARASLASYRAKVARYRFHPELSRLPLSPLAGVDEFSHPSSAISARQSSQPLISRSISASVATGGISIML